MMRFNLYTIIVLVLFHWLSGQMIASEVIIPSAVSAIDLNAYGGTGITQLIDNSGMTTAVNNGDSLETALFATHYFGSSYNRSYVSNGSGADYFSGYGAQNPPVIVWDLTGGGDTRLDGIILWQYENNGGNGVNIGNQAYEISFQFNSAIQGSELFTGPITTIYLKSVLGMGGINAAQLFEFDTHSQYHRYVRMTITDNHYGDPAHEGVNPISGGDRVGLGEVRFVTTSGPVVPSGKAWNPDPSDKQTDIPVDITLHWNTGEVQDPTDPYQRIPNPDLIKHVVYLGNSSEELSIQAEIPILIPVPVLGQYSPPDLKYNQIYYWRVDEYIDQNTIITGDLWSFTTTLAPDQRCEGFLAGDINNDCLVEMTDLSLLADQWLEDVNCAGFNCGDVDESGLVDSEDFSCLTQNWQEHVSIVITEFMASNSLGGIVDEDGTSSDWMELRNYCESPVNLEGWYLTDNDNELDKWQFPSICLDPGEYLIVFASGKDRRDPNHPLHTNFTLDISSEYLGLVGTDGQTIIYEYCNYPIQYEDISYGLALRPGETLISQNYFLSSTPGHDNADPLANPGPTITQVSHTPSRPSQSDPLTVTAKVTANRKPIATITLIYRVMYESEVKVEMFDDGSHNDSLADDGIYGATIPAGIAGPGQMIRYYLMATDSVSGESRMPMFLDKIGTNQSPQYYGTVVTDPGLASNLPIMEWFTTSESASHTRGGARVSVYYNGRFYDNIFVRQRGQATNNYSQKFDFNKGDDFYVNEKMSKVGEVNMNAQGADPAYIRQTLTFDTHRWCGTPSCISIPVLMQLNGEFDRIGILIEQVDEDFLKRYDKDPDGALYKFVQRHGETEDQCAPEHIPYLPHTPCFSDTDNGIEKKTRRWEDFSDLQAVVDGLNAPSEDERRRFVFDNFNLPEMISYLAARAIANDCDDTRKNYYFYCDTLGTGEWEIYPWDNDFSFGIYGDGGPYRAHPFFGDEEHLKTGTNQWNVFFDVMFNLPETRMMYLRRLRTMMDELLQPPMTPAEQLKYEPICDTMAEPILAHINIESYLNGVKAYFPSRRNELYNIYGPESSEPLIPDSLPASDYFTLPGKTLEITDIEFNPATGNQDQEYIKIVNHSDIAADVSGWHLTGGVAFTFPSGTVIVAGNSLYVSPNVRAFRSRPVSPRGNESLFVVGGYDGHLSNWGETITLTDASHSTINSYTYQADPSDQQRYLRITELMYHPIPGGAYHEEEYEYIELKNISENSLSLTGIKFTNGIDYQFDSRTLDPDEYIVIAKNREAFAERYDLTDLNLATGQYTGSLANDGENIKLEDASSNTIHDFKFNDQWFYLTDGTGFSLQIIDESSNNFELWDTAEGWRVSSSLYGSPGKADTGVYIPGGTIVINEILAYTDDQITGDWIELRNLSSNQGYHLGGWFLSDDNDNLEKFEIPSGTYIPPDDFLVFTANEHFDNPEHSGTRVPFTLSETGGSLYLSSGLNGALTGLYSEEVNFEATTKEITIGRYIKSLESGYDVDFVLLESPSKGSDNHLPLVGPVVISEIMFDPAEPDSEGEYIRLQNITNQDIHLYDSSEPAHTWQFTQGISYAFPAGVTIQAGGYLLVTRDNPDVFRNNFEIKLGIPPQILIYGPYDGKLDNDGEKLTLSKPGDPIPDSGLIPYIRVDRVNYGITDPWPTDANETGKSLQRRYPDQYGNDAINWKSDFPSF